MKPQPPPPETFTWNFDTCYVEGCDKHASPTGPPKQINPTWGELSEHADATARWVCYHRPTTSNGVKLMIDELIQDSETTDDYLSAYQLAVLAGMCYWSIKESDYIWRE